MVSRRIRRCNKLHETGVFFAAKHLHKPASPLSTSYITPRAALPHSPLHVSPLSFPSFPVPLLTSFFLLPTHTHYCLTAFFNIPDHTPPFFAIFIFASTFFFGHLSLPLLLTLLHMRERWGLLLAGLGCGLPWQTASSCTDEERKKPT